MRKSPIFLFILAMFVMLVLPVMPTRAAESVHYEYIDGTAISATDTTADTAFTNADAEISGAGYTVIGYLYDTCRFAAAPNIFTTETTLKAVTTKNVTQYGSIGECTWFIYDSVLYITGNGTIADVSSLYATASRTDAHSGVAYDIETPNFYSNTNGYFDGGVEDPYLADELDNDGVPEFTPSLNTYTPVTVTDGGQGIKLTGVRYYRPSSGVLSPTAVGWYSSAYSITKVYVSQDVKITGNMSFLFNATSSYALVGSVNESAYKNLEEVYLYADLSGVTSTAGLFARCPKLTHVHTMGNGMVDLSSDQATAFMFYGDEKLLNEDGASLINCMNFNTGELVNTSYMFGDCPLIYHPLVSHYNMQNVTMADGMFYGAKKAGLISVQGGTEGYNLQSWRLNSLISGNFMFNGVMPGEGSVNLTNPQTGVDPGLEGEISSSVISGVFDMSNWGMGNCLETYYMLAQNSALTGVVLPKEMPSLIDATGMLMRCDYLANVDASGLNTPALIHTTGMLRGSGRKASGGTADFSGWNCPALTYAGIMFANTGFKTINLDNSSDMSNLEVATAMFASNESLTSVGTNAMGHMVFRALKEPQFMFNYSDSLAALNTRTWDMSHAQTLDFMLNQCKSLHEGVDFSAWNIGNETVSMQNFAYYTAFPVADLSGWDTSAVTHMDLAFTSNRYLETVKMPEGANAFSTLESLLGIFSGDKKLKTLTGLGHAAPNLKDIRLMCALTESLESVDVSNLVGSNTQWINSAFIGAVGLKSLDLSTWNTSGVIYAQNFLFGATSLTSITGGNGISAVSMTDAARFFRECHVLSSDSLNAFLKYFDDSSSLKIASEMFMNDYALTSLDLSPMDLSAATSLTRLAAMEENADFETNHLTTIKVPATILTASGASATNSSGECIHMFWVDGDGAYDGEDEEDSPSDDLVTYFFVDGTMPSKLAKYMFGGIKGSNDNRCFVKFNGRTIDGEDTGYAVLSDLSDTKELAVDVESTLFINGTDPASADAVPLMYEWGNETTMEMVGKGVGMNTYTTQAGSAATYDVYYAPNAILLADDVSVKVTTFIVGPPITAISATYKGEDVTVGTAYSKDDVEVKVVDSDGNEILLTSNDFTVDSQQVSQKGMNTYTASYKVKDKVYTDSFTVNGVRRIGLIKATYSGLSVLVGSEYSKEDISVTAYYVDDTSKKEGFEVTPTAYSTSKITTVGDNIVTVTYTDTAQNKDFTDQVTINGYKTITSIGASYNGPKIPVGNNYSKDNVVLTLYYADGTTGTTTNFTVDSLLVTQEGGNSYTATYRDPFGNNYTAGYSVFGSNIASTILTPGNAGSSNVVSSSNYVAPSESGSVAGASLPKTNSGSVQTGRTEMGILFAIFALVAACGLVVTIWKRRHDEV